MKQAIESIHDMSYRYPGEHMKIVRIRLGITQKDAAYRVGMSPSGLSKLECGRNIQPRKLLELSELYGMNPKELTPYSKPKNETIEDGLKTIKKLFPHNWQDVIKKGIKEIL